MAGPWLNIKEDEWKNVKFCGECGLPLLYDKSETYCPYCSWVEQEQELARLSIQLTEYEKNKEIKELKNKLKEKERKYEQQINELKQQIGWNSPRGGDRPVEGVRYEVVYENYDGLNLDFLTYLAPGYWEYNIEPLFFRLVQMPLI